VYGALGGSGVSTDLTFGMAALSILAGVNAIVISRARVEGTTLADLALSTSILACAAIATLGLYLGLGIFGAGLAVR